MSTDQMSTDRSTIESIKPKQSFEVSKFFAWSALVAVLVLLSSTVSASVIISNEMASEWTNNNTGVQIYPYGSGQQHVADFSTGTLTNTVNSGGVLELTTSNDWWHTDWQQRQCFDVKSTDTVAEYPIRFEVDTSASSSNGDDIRVIEVSTQTELTSYSEGPFPDTTSVVWGQAEPLPAGVSTYCVYFDNPAAASVSDEVGTFSYDSGQVVRYYTMYDRYTNGANARVTVVSYSANNVVSDGTTTVTLQPGQFHTFDSLTKDSVITATGAIDASYDATGKEALLPEGFADTRFTFPTRRYTERFWIRSPHGTTTVEAVANGAVIGSATVGPASGSVELIAPGVGTQFVSLRSTDGTKFLAAHSGTNDQDTMLGVPWFGDTLYGVASNNLNMGALTNTTVSWVRNDGGSQPNQAVSMNGMTVVGGNGAYGNGRAYAITGSGDYFHAAQQADNDGTEVTSFLPRRLLSQTYRLPIRARYFTIACPVVGTAITIDGTPAGACNGTGVGFFYGGFGTHAAGTLIEADNPIFVYYESRNSRDEDNIFGPKGNIPYLEAHKMAAGPVQTVPASCGTWVSPALPTAGVAGLFSVADSLPTGSSATYQISTDGSPFYGPDGTPTSSFVDGDIIPYLADFSATFQFRVELCTNSATAIPSVSSLSAGYNLTEVVSNVSVVDALTVQSTGTTQTTHLVRVYQSTPGAWQAWVEYESGTNIAQTDATFTTDTPTTQVGVLGGVVSDPRPAFSHQSGQPYTLSADHSKTAGAPTVLSILLVDDGEVRIENGLEINFVD